MSSSTPAAAPAAGHAAEPAVGHAAEPAAGHAVASAPAPTAGHAKLTTWQAACIITGYGVGSGIMTLPYLVTKAGTVSALLLLAAAFVFSYLMHAMLAEMCIGAGPGVQMVGMFRKHLIRGRFEKPIIICMFVLVTLVLVFNLAAYVAGGAEILESFGVPALAAKIIFYAVAAGVVFFGLKVLGVSEAVAVDGIIAIVAVLAIASLFHLDSSVLYPSQGAMGILAFFGMAMMAFVAFFSVPQAVEGLDRNPVKVRSAIKIGLTVNALFILVITGCSLAASDPEVGVTQLAMIGWSAGIGPWAQLLGSAFTLLAMLTTYWSISRALSDIVAEQTGLSSRVCWVIATLPSLLLVLFDLGSFLELMRLAGGLIAILISLMVVPAFRNCRREQGRLLLSERLGSTPVQILVVLAFILMAVGNVVPV